MPEVGHIEEVYSSPKTIEWTVPNFFLLPNHIGFSIASPIFTFREHSCRLLALPNGTDSLPGVTIVMLTGIGKIGRVHWELQIHRTDFTLLRKAEGVKTDGHTEEMNMFIMYKEIEKGCYNRGFFSITCKLSSENDTREELTHKGASAQTESTSRTDKLSEDLKELLQSGNNSDMTIKVKGQEFKTHRSIVCARSPVFASMFRHEMCEKITGIVEIEDCEPDVFKEFLHYIYTGRFQKLTSKIVFDLFEAADKYQMGELKAYCLEFMKNSAVSVDTYCDILGVSLRYGEQVLMDIAISFFSENVAHITKSDKWQNFSIENPTESHKLLLDVLKKQDEILKKTTQ